MTDWLTLFVAQVQAERCGDPRPPGPKADRAAAKRMAAWTAWRLVAPTLRQRLRRQPLLQGQARSLGPRLATAAFRLDILTKRGSQVLPGALALRLLRWHPALGLETILHLLLESAWRHQRGQLTWPQLLEIFPATPDGRPRLVPLLGRRGDPAWVPDTSAADAYEAQQRYQALLRAFGLTPWHQRTGGPARTPARTTSHP